MAKNIVALLLFFTLPASLFAQHGTKEPERLAQQVVTSFYQALAKLDVAKAKILCTADVIILESGQVWNFDSLALRLTTRKAKSPDFKRLNTFNFIQTRLTAASAWLSYFNEAVISFDGKTTYVKWLETVVLTRDKNDWKISLLHSTEMQREVH